MCINVKIMFVLLPLQVGNNLNIYNYKLLILKFVSTLFFTIRVFVEQHDILVNSITLCNTLVINYHIACINF